MDAPEYLDLDEIDFTDDLPLSSKSIPELCRRHDGPSDDRQAPGVHWARSGSSLNSTAVKPTGIADVYSKFRPVKRVSPLKHQPEVSDSETQGKHEEPDATASKDDSAVVPTTIRNQKSKAMGNGGMFGELEHYDLDMDEILDVPYIKSSQQQVPQTSTLPRMKPSTLVHSESLNSAAQFCLLSPANWPDMRKSKSVDLRAQNAALEMDGDMIGPFTDSKLGADGKQMMFGTRGMRVREIDEESKKIQNILNIVREGQISLLPHLAVEHLECVRDEDGNNLLHISASRGHCECLQHLTTLMGEDFLNERNTHQLTPAGLAVRNGQLECVRWLVSDTEAIAELSCTREHPSLIHYAARHGQERVLLWLLQFMQEQGISLDEVDPDGSTAVHVAAQFGHLSCLQTLVEYGSNVTVLNLQGERPSQNAERQGHSACSRYLVVVESCMSLASQVVKLTKQLHQQTTARVALQNQLQLLLQTQESTGQPSSPSARGPPVESWAEMTLTAEAGPESGQLLLKQKNVHQGVETVTGPVPCPMKRLETADVKLARLKQIMQRSLSESDGDGYPPDDAKNASRTERPNQLAITEAEQPKTKLSSERKFLFTHRTSKSIDVCNPSPSSENSDPESKMEAGESHDGNKATTSPKSALKSPTSRRKTAQNLKLRVTFDEPPRKDGSAAVNGKPVTAKEKADSGKRAFGTFRSIMETLSGNQNGNNNNIQSPGKKKSEAKNKSKMSAV